jgi:hypothetical protein
MAQKNNALIVFGSLVVIGSVGYYLWSKSKKSKGEGSSEPTPNDKPEVGKGTTEPPKSGKGKVDELTIPSWLDTTAKVKYFQDWLDSKYPTWLNGKQLKKGSGYGKLGPSTTKAWQNYMNEYILFARNKAVNDKFKPLQDVTANQTFKASAVIYRNNSWFTTDGDGVSLPQRTWNKDANVGTIKEILPNGNIIVNVPADKGPTYGTRVYRNIIVRPIDIK